MDFQDWLHLLFSGSTAAIAVAAVFVAREAIGQGLAFVTQRATLWALAFFAVGRIWNTVKVLVGRETIGAEFIEYALYFAGYFLFILLTVRVRKLRPIMKREAAPEKQAKNSPLP
mgnify:CR=1 FL=1